jgi:hypothetical protein
MGSLCGCLTVVKRAGLLKGQGRQGVYEQYKSEFLLAPLTRPVVFVEDSAMKLAGSKLSREGSK